MGQALLSCAAQSADLHVVGQVDQGEDLRSAIETAQVVIDFSSHDATEKVVRLCAENRIACVIGTTGHSEQEKKTIRAYGSVIPMVWSSNYSTGVNVLFWLTRRATQILGPEFDPEVVEMHHRFKKDAPSGTARTLAEIVATVREDNLDDVGVHGRRGLVGERTRNEIGVHSLRGGDVVGDHTVVFAANGERLELTHKAASRDTFANGALRAARWVVNQKPGVYDMEAVLGLK